MMIVDHEIDSMDELLFRLRDKTGCDFSALAHFERSANRIRWLRASGNLNDRYKSIVQKPGSGIAGNVIRFGRLFVLDESISGLEGLRRTFPLMMVEQLHAVLAAPVMADSLISGVLMIGSRSEKRFAESEIALLERTAEQFSPRFLK